MKHHVKQNKGVEIKDSFIKVNGDIIGRDKITNINQTLADGDFSKIMLLWELNMKEIVEKKSLSLDEKKDINLQIENIKDIIVNEKGNNPGEIKKLINTLAKMSPDIFDVAIATLANPLAGIGLVIKKVSDKAKVEIQAE